MMVLCCGRPPNCWTLTLLLLACFGYRSATSQYSAPDVSYEMPMGLTRSGMPSGSDPTSATLPEVTHKHGCCKGTLGFASANYRMPYPCARSNCCNDSEAVAVIPVDEALGFQFVCMPRTSIRTLCYQAGSEVCTSNQDPDHVPRTCCIGARFAVQLNQWFAAMTIKCVDQLETEYTQR